MARGSGGGDRARRLAAERRAAEQTALRLAREAERQRMAGERRDREAYLRQRTQEAADRTAAVEQRMRELETLLAQTLKTAIQPLDFSRVKRTAPFFRLDLGADAQPITPPDWSMFAPPPPGLLGKIFGGVERQARAESEARRAFEAAVQQHRQAETARQRRVTAARQHHADRLAKAQAETRAQHEKIDRFQQAVRAGDRHAVSQYFQRIIDGMPDPSGLPRQRRCGYVPESTLLAVEWRLPTTDVVPADRTYRYVKARDSIEATARSATDIRRTYQNLVAQLALRALRVAFGSDPANLVSTIVFNGIVEAIEPSTGQTIMPCLITLRATRDQFSPLVLERVDPAACIRKHFAAKVSAHPDELQAVQPVMEFNLADPRVVDPVDIISGLDQRPNLLEYSATEFESFVQNLFTRMGLEARQFRAGGDGGVDCMVYDPTPVLGGMYAVQAKLYAKTVPPTAVRDLYGTMQHEGATKGILITTSGFGPSSYEFANGKPLQLIDGSGLLALCKQYGIPARIVPTQRRTPR